MNAEIRTVIISPWGGILVNLGQLGPVPSLLVGEVFNGWFQYVFSSVDDAFLLLTGWCYHNGLFLQSISGADGHFSSRVRPDSVVILANAVYISGAAILFLVHVLRTPSSDGMRRRTAGTGVHMNEVDTCGVNLCS